MNYVGIMERYKSILIDLMILIGLAYCCSLILDSFQNVPENLRISIFVFITILYEPIFVSLFGGTLGHFMMGIRVKKENDPSKNINIIAAIFRWIVKSLLGWISLFTVSSGAKKQAIHDHLVGSVVIFKE
jgi:uncharacterized RDD family membrane protein YckC